MIVLGINAGITKNGRPLNDGGACLVKDGKIVCAIQEERITRNKYEGGFEKSIVYVCEKAKMTYNKIDKVVVSSCVDELWTVDEASNIARDIELTLYGKTKSVFANDVGLLMEELA